MTAPSLFLQTVEGPDLTQGHIVKVVDEDGNAHSFACQPVSSGGGAATAYVYRPGGTAGPGVYTTSASLLAAVNSVDPAAEKVVSVDSSLAAAHIGGGPWPDNITWQSGDASVFSTLTLDEGTTFTVGTIRWRNMVMQTSNATPVLTVPLGKVATVIMGPGAVLTPTGAGNIFADVAGTLSLSAFECVIGDGVAEHELFEVEATGSLACFLFDGTTFASDTVKQGAAPGGALGLTFDAESQSGVSTVQTLAPTTISNLDPQATFVFRPGATSLGGANVFTTWAALMAAAALSPGNKTIIIDDSLAAAHMTAGAWNLDNVTLWGNQASPTFTLHVDTGATFTSSSLRIANGLQVICENTTASPWTPTTFFELLIEPTCLLLSAAGAKPFLDIENATASTSPIVMWANCTLGDGTHNVVKVGAGFQVFVVMTGPSPTGIAAHAFGGTGTATVQRDSASNVSATQDITTFTITNESNASAVAYTPTTAGNWNPIPATTKAGLDQLAASNTTSGTGNTGTGTATVTATAAAITKAKNGQMRVSASCALSSSAACTLTVQLKKDGANIGTPKSVVAAAAINAMDAGISFIDTAADNAAHTYSCTWTASAGTLTVAAGSAQIQVLEDS